MGAAVKKKKRDLRKESKGPQMAIITPLRERAVNYEPT